MPTPMDHVGLFESSPNPYLVLDRSLHIAGANRAYLASVKRDLSDIVGRWAWDAFPTDPETERQAVASFERVIRTKQTDTMALLRFDVPRPENEGGGFSKHYWSITHTPIFDDQGEVSLVLQHPIDVTELEMLRESVRISDEQAAVRLRPAHTGIFERARDVFQQNLSLQEDRERLERMFAKAPSFIAMLEGPNHVFRLVNEAYMHLIGHRDVMGRTVAEALPEAASQGYVGLLDDVFRSGRHHVASSAPYAVQTNPERPIDQRYLDFLYQPILDGAGQATGIFVEGYDVTERVLVGIAQQEAMARDAFLLSVENRLRPLAEADAILNVAAEALGRHLMVDQVAYSDIDPTMSHGVIEHEWNSGAIASNRGIHVIDDFGEGFAADLRAGRTVVVDDIQTDPRTSSSDGLATFERVAIRAFINLPIVKNGRLVALFTVHSATLRTWSRDETALVEEVSERVWASVVRARAEANLRLAETQRAELSQEMAHRLKNVLAMVQSIATQTFRTAGSVAEARDAVSGRIAALARAQDILTQTQWEAAPILHIVTTALSPHRNAEADRFEIGGPRIELTSQQGLGLSLALHELATNAAKYGALSNADGKVTIAWAQAPDGTFRFEWRETGGPLVLERTRTGFGSRLVERLVAAYFDGETSLVFDPAGVRFELLGKVAPQAFRHDEQAEAAGTGILTDAKSVSD